MAPGVVIPAILASVVTPVAIVAWLLVGPLQTGWARRAGTPSTLRRTVAASASSPVASATSPTAAPGPAQAGTTAAAAGTVAFRLPANAKFQGHLTQTNSPGGPATVTIDATLTGTTPGHLVIVLTGTALPAGGISMSTSAVSLGPPSGPAPYHGTVTALVGPQITVAWAAPGNARVVVDVHLATGSGNTVTGTMIEERSGA